MGGAGDAEDGDAVAVAHTLGGNRFAGVNVQHGDQIGHGDLDLVINAGDQVFILEADLKLLAAVFVDAIHKGVTFGETGLGASLDIANLAFEDKKAAHLFAHGLHRVEFADTSGADGAANLFGFADSAGNGALFQVAGASRIECDHGSRAHIHGDAASKALRPAVVDRLQENGVAPLVGHRHGGGADAVDGVRHHLNFGEGAAHAVTIDQRQAQARCHIDRHNRV